ncbi:MAG: electron transfer flavoprotein subunit beta [Candidatus Melainabacteria bacterium]
MTINDSGPVLEGAPMMLNPYDEYALETAIRLKEAAGESATLTAVSIGAPGAKEILKKAIAVGADSAVLVSDPALNGIDSAAASRVLQTVIMKDVPDAKVIFCGQSALDDASGQTGARIAALLDRPALTFCKEATLNGDGLNVVRESEQGLETHSMQLPGVVCVMKCDYELRGSNIKGVMKANKADIPTRTLADLGVDVAPVLTLMDSRKRPAKTEGKKVDGSNPAEAVNALMTYLREAKIV